MRKMGQKRKNNPSLCEKVTKSNRYPERIVN